LLQKDGRGARPEKETGTKKTDWPGEKEYVYDMWAMDVCVRELRVSWHVSNPAVWEL
jgi:hypothetical protein